MRMDPPSFSAIKTLCPAWDSSLEYSMDAVLSCYDESVVPHDTRQRAKLVLELIRHDLALSLEDVPESPVKRQRAVEDYLQQLADADVDDDGLTDLFAWEYEVREKKGHAPDMNVLERRYHDFLASIRRHRKDCKDLESSIRTLLKKNAAALPSAPPLVEPLNSEASLPRLLSKLNPFSQLPPRVCEEIASHAVEAKFEAGHVLFRQGEASDCLIVLLEGSVEISVSDRGRSHIIATLDERTVIGELGLLTSEPRSGSVVATTAGRIAVISREKFAHLISAHPTLSIAFSELIAKRVGTLSIDVLCGKSIQGYKLHRRIGRGGMGIVYAALDQNLNEERAVKMLRHDLVYDRGTLRRFHQEASIVKSLRHPNIVRMYDEFSAYGTCFVAMELCDGMSLSAVMQRYSPMPLPAIRGIIGQLARALEHTHMAGIAHRDLKPSNVMVLTDGTVKLTDFGLARSPMSLDTELTEQGQIMGTPRYMSPEQMLGERGDCQSDLYSLGLVLYELVTGVPLFTACSFRELIRERGRWQLPDKTQICDELPNDLFEILQQTLVDEPEGRTVDLARVSMMADAINWNHLHANDDEDEMGLEPLDRSDPFALTQHSPA
jgi:CRP-like cAMP-binding protein/tRNA A-37 threonylcarbamoyl transferase component Bud32